MKPAHLNCLVTAFGLLASATDASVGEGAKAAQAGSLRALYALVNARLT